MGGLEQAVERTRRYAAFFGCFLSDDDLYRWLISGKTYSAQSLKRLFPQKTKPRTDFSAPKLKQAGRVAKLVSFLPTVSIVAVTGSLAVKNAKPEDDIDLMIITKPNTLWLTRLLLVPLVSLFFKRRRPPPPHTPEVCRVDKRHPPHTPGVCEVDTPGVCLKWADAICLNLWLDETTLAVPANKRNLYTAHEVLQAKPLFDRGGVHAKFISANSWTSKYLANAYSFAKSNFPSLYPRRGNPLLRKGEALRNPNWLVKWNFLSILNILAFKLQYFYMKRKITRETITLNSAYFHPNDYSAKLNLDG